MVDHVVIFKDMDSEDVDWIRLAKDRTPWCAPMNAVMKLRILTHACPEKDSLEACVRPSVRGRWRK
jgi:hypothetical protein